MGKTEIDLFSIAHVNNSVSEKIYTLKILGKNLKLNIYPRCKLLRNFLNIILDYLVGFSHTKKWVSKNNWKDSSAEILLQHCDEQGGTKKRSKLA